MLSSTEFLPSNQENQALSHFQRSIVVDNHPLRKILSHSIPHGSLLWHGHARDAHDAEPEEGMLSMQGFGRDVGGQVHEGKKFEPLAKLDEIDLGFAGSRLGESIGVQRTRGCLSDDA